MLSFTIDNTEVNSECTVAQRSVKNITLVIICKHEEHDLSIVYCTTYILNIHVFVSN